MTTQQLGESLRFARLRKRKSSSESTYQLTIVALGFSRAVKLSDAEFTAIKDAKRDVLALLGIEEKFELLVNNYSEYELGLLGIAVGTMLHRNYAWDGIIDDIQTVNRRVVNILTATRLYIDQSKHAMSEIFGKASGQYQSIERAFSTEYDNVLGYRVMEKLRNHAQHRELPVRRLEHPSGWLGEGSNAALRCAVRPLMDISLLREDRKNFSGKLIQEIEQGGDAAHITKYIREFVAALSRVHELIRSTTSSRSGDALSILTRTIAKGKQRLKDTRGLAAVAVDSTGQFSETVYIMNDLMERYKRKVKQNANLSSLPRWYVSGELVPTLPQRSRRRPE